MTEHRKQRPSLTKRFTRKQLVASGSSLLAAMMLIGGGIATTHLYGSENKDVTDQITSYSATDLDSVSAFTAASRSSARTAIKNGQAGADKDATYVTVVVNGKPQLVFGSDFTTVKSVLEAGHITLDTDDTVSPDLSEKVTESTVITINRPNTTIETSTEKIAFNTIKKQSSTLAAGQTKVETEGQEGEMETTNLVKVVDGKKISTNTLASWVKKAPVNKVILVGTATTGSSSGGSANYGTTMPVGEAQALAHALVVARGWSESEFTCLVRLWQRESGWRSNAHNASGAHGIPQALPGSKMGPGWENDASVQINWGIGYIAGRYGTPCGAWNHSETVGSY